MYSSLFVLNNMNIGSLYFGDLIPHDLSDFVRACQMVSIDILKVYKGVLDG
jgi:hypothetical protein